MTPPPHTHTHLYLSVRKRVPVPQSHTVRPIHSAFLFKKQKTNKQTNKNKVSNLHTGLPPHDFSNNALSDPKMTLMALKSRVASLLRMLTPRSKVSSVLLQGQRFPGYRLFVKEITSISNNKCKISIKNYRNVNLPHCVA